MVSTDAPVTEYENGTRKPFNWVTVEQYLKDKGQSMEHFNKAIGMDKECKEAFEQARKRYMDALNERPD